MKFLYAGKTKDVLAIEESDGIGYVGKFVMPFKDSATGYIVDKGLPTERVVFDSGYDRVVGEIPGKGIIDCQATIYFLSLLKNKGIPTHFIKQLDDRRIIVEPADLFSLKNEAQEFEGSDNLHNLEVVFRKNYYGSLWRRHPYVRPCSHVNNLVEIYTKGLPHQDDQLIRDDTLIELGIMKPQEIEEVKSMAKKVSDIIAEEFSKRDLHMLDGKIEVGKRQSDGKLIVIDEISTSVFRGCNKYTPDDKGNCKVYKDCISTSCKDGKLTILAKNLITSDQIAEAFGF